MDNIDGARPLLSEDLDTLGLAVAETGRLVAELESSHDARGSRIVELETRIVELETRIVELEARIVELETGGMPDTLPAQLSGPRPFWPLGPVDRLGPGHEEASPWLANALAVGSVSRAFVKGTAPVEIEYGGIDIRRLVVQLDERHRSVDPVIGSSGVLETFNELPVPGREIELETVVEFLDRPGDGWPGVIPQYVKIAGAKIWDGTWPNHAAGNNVVPNGASVRIIVWNYNKKPEQAQFGLRIYQSPANSGAPIGYDGQGRSVIEWPVNGGPITEYLPRFLRGTWKLTETEPVRHGKSYHLRLAVKANDVTGVTSMPNGSATLWVNGELALNVEGIRFVTALPQGQVAPMFNWAGITAMIGGTDPAILPDTPNRGVKLAFDKFVVR